MELAPVYFCKSKESRNSKGDNSEDSRNPKLEDFKFNKNNAKAEKERDKLPDGNRAKNFILYVDKLWDNKLLHTD